MKRVVFFLHRVYPNSNKKRDDISLSGFIKALKLISLRFKIVSLHELLDKDVKSNKPLAAITFDDGYKDNFVYAYPILKKMGIPAHLFITANRILDSEKVEKNLFDYWNGKVSFEELYKPTSMYYGHEEFIKKGYSEEFLSWKELELMKDVFSYGAHSANHFSFPYKEEIIDFFDGSNFDWSMLLYSKEPFNGLPKFPTRSELDIRKFYPSKELLKFCRDFPKKGNWKKSLRLEIEKNFKTFGSYETEEEAKKRIKTELIDSKKKIEKRLGITVDNFSWPFGHYSELSKDIASQVYTYVFTIKKGFVEEDSDLAELPRVSLGKDIFTVLGRILTFSTDLGYAIYKKVKKEKVL
ncbi:polysaccharide deacetylase [Desulfurobacterium thermolithotrophum DSM 11699]|uniref:Polysaccharide deacetylase n=1 Tax=Desulfurobacterium thermolithotrophum (strain DSM 11699 / BSA) TaxID=868864 RepID=F0S1Y8_DESTD|nr:polysaccharide deacetylase family protein [Desulfurobacterium thermolithotrophum]ADY74069.1 polysaccharide deacetylase [Desulfurobacterium thermolithotrophum DSM 11699]